MATGYLCPFGLWRSLVARSVRVGEVAGSNPVSPINSVPRVVAGKGPPGCPTCGLGRVSYREDRCPGRPAVVRCRGLLRLVLRAHGHRRGHGEPRHGSGRARACPGPRWQLQPRQRGQPRSQRLPSRRPSEPSRPHSPVASAEGHLQRTRYPSCRAAAERVRGAVREGTEGAGRQPSPGSRDCFGFRRRSLSRVRRVDALRPGDFVKHLLTLLALLFR
jgi:hypothetical protein